MPEPTRSIDPATTARHHEPGDSRRHPEHSDFAPALNVAPGSIVKVRDAEWLVTQATQTRDGLLIRAHGLSELVRDTTASFYEKLDEIEPVDPASARVKADGSPKYRQARLWLEATLRKTPVPMNQPGLTVSTRMLSNTLGYQQSAVRQALDPENLRPRVLIADAVGLGKTIEIGMILSELVRRGRGDRILIVTPKHVLEQMQYEMWTRFALPFVRLDSVGIQRVRQKLPATRNPFSLYKRAIISIDTLKQDKYKAHLRKHKWDAVVIDESHGITGATQSNELARILAPNTEALILASATPHNGKKESFAELVRLLEPTAVTPAGDVIQSELRRLVIRRHRHSAEVAREVGSDWAERKELQHFTVDATPAEDAVAEELAEVWLYPKSGSSPFSGDNKGLFPWTLAKAYLSSPAALLESVRERRKRLGSDRTDAQEREFEALTRLEALASEATAAGATSAKYAKLIDYLRHIGVAPKADTRAVIFSERVATLKWLEQSIRKDLKLSGEQVRVLHGGLSDVEQQEIVEDFKKSSSRVRVLVTGDVASEGVNLHSQCHELIHFDIPWSLIRIEQRNGRVDRYGQKHPPQISTILLKPSNEKFAGDIRVLTRLMEREQEAHTALGDVASLMGEYDAKAEENAIMSALAKRREADSIVPTIDDVMDKAADDPFLAFLQAGFAAGAAGDDTDAATTTAAAVDDGSGLFTSDDAFLAEALHEIYPTPGAKPSAGGIHWRTHTQHGLAEFAPPLDLVQRLDVLPQSYLRDRGVTREFTLAVRELEAQHALADARDNPMSTSLWPEAHYLGPLHPVLDWASDRTLAKLGRNEVFVVRGGVDFPTVLLVGTLSNRRGQVVASSFLTAEFQGSSFQPFVTPHESARDAIAALQLATSNAGPIDDVRSVQALIRPAVAHADDQLRIVADEAAKAVEARVDRWSQRVEQWGQYASAERQDADLKRRRLTVEEELAIAESMKPNRQLVRPLLVVVPEEEG